MIASSYSGQVLTLTSNLFNVPCAEILSLNRDAETVRARQAAMSALREVKGFSFPRIGRLFGRDHTTVMHGCGKVAALLTSNIEFASRYALLVREAEALNDSILDRMRKTSMIDINLIKPRLTTIEVCDLAGYGPQTLLKRIRDGRMPQPIDKAKQHIFERDAVLRALNLIDTQPQEAGQW